MILPTRVDTQSDEFRQRREHQQKLLDELQGHLEVARGGGGPDRVGREHRRGKLTARERIDRLRDPGAQILELSALAGGDELYREEGKRVKVPCGGMITAITQVSGRTCMIMAHDQTVKGGSYFPITVKKHLRAQEIAAANRLICLYLVDSGGAYLPRQSEVFPDRDDFGRIFYNQAHLSAAGIPQLASIHGPCTAGGAYIPAMSEFTVMVRGQGRIFLAGPPLVKAATGEDISAEDLGGAQVHSRESGLVDELCDSDEEALDCLRRMVSQLSRPRSRDGNVSTLAPQFSTSATPQFSTSAGKPPRYPIEDLLGILPPHPKTPWDGKELLGRLLDDSEFTEFKSNYGATLITGWGEISGIRVGALMNRGVLTAAAAQKGCHFIDLCESRGIALLFLQNISGFMVGRDAEAGGIAKEGAKMVSAVSRAGVPKITVITGGSHGAGNYAMCGRAFGGDFVFTWPSARISVMGAEQAGFVLAQLGSKSWSEEQKTRWQQKWERESSPYWATARLWDDGLINPLQTRHVVSLALAATLSRPVVRAAKGVVRM